MVAVWSIVNIGNLPSVDRQTEILLLLERILKDDFNIVLFLPESPFFPPFFTNYIYSVRMSQN